MTQMFSQICDDHYQTINKISHKEVASLVNAMCDALDRGYTIFVCGNGGSAADAQHFVAELVVKFGCMRKAISAIALTTNTSVITAAGNDFDYDSIFERQVEAVGRNGDILLCLSTSGESVNVLRAATAAREKSMRVLSITGCEVSSIATESDVTLVIEGTPARIQEGTMLVLHYLALIADEVIVDANT